MGNPHGVGQAPLTFVRQALALCTAPFLLEHPSLEQLFPSDVIAVRTHLQGFLGWPGV